MAQVKIRGQSGENSKINGIIEEYKVASGGNINAGDFVKFVGNQYGTDTKLSTSSYSGDYVSAVLIETNKVFVVYAIGQGTTSFKFNLYGMICTIEGTTITAGSSVKLSDDYYSKKSLLAISIDTNKIFILFGGMQVKGNDTSNLYGMVCTIEGTTISAGIVTQLSSQTASGNYTSIVLLENNKVFIAHSFGSGNLQYSLNGMICTIENMTITVKTDVEIHNNTDKPNLHCVSSVLLENNTVFIAFASGETSSPYNSDLYGMVCTIENTTITIGNEYIIDTNGYYYVSSLSILLLKKNKVFIAFGRSASNGGSNLYGMICTIENATITTGVATQLAAGIKNISAVLLNENEIFIAHHSSNLYGMICTIEEATITEKSNAQISNTACYSYNKTQSLLLLNSYKICILFGISTSAYLNSIVGDVELVDMLKNKTDNILGVAKTKGVENQVIKVIVPN